MSSPEERAAFRAFVREHHPDRGGDPARFAEGVDRLRARPAEPDAGPPGRAEPEDPPPLPFPVRVGVALIRTWRRRHGRRPDGS
jgi:hypothetical protein